MGGLRQGAAGHLLDVPRRRAGDRRRAAAVRASSARTNCSTATFASGHTVAVVLRQRRVAADRVLHVPAGVPGVPRASGAACGAGVPGDRGTQPARTRPPARCAAPDGDRAGRAGGRGGAGRLRRACRRALGGSNRIEHFLEPSFTAAADALPAPRHARRRRPARRIGRRRSRGGTATPAATTAPSSSDADGRLDRRRRSSGSASRGSSS